MDILLDGKTLANEMTEIQKQKVEELRKKNIIPRLAAIIVGDDPASEQYVRMKTKRCKKLGIESDTYHLDKKTFEQDLIDLILRLNADKSVSGILTQLPLPRQICEESVIESISPLKDVDCFHPFNVGRLSIGNPVFAPATPAGVIRLLERYGCELSGKNAVVIGRSNIVGKPGINPPSSKELHSHHLPFQDC